MRKVLFVKFNDMRRPEFRISTSICEEDGKRIVEKIPCHELAIPHILGMRKNYEQLKHAHTRIDVTEAFLSDNKVCFAFLNGITIEEKLKELVGNGDQLINELKVSLERIYSYASEALTEFYMTPAYEDVFGDGSLFLGEPATLAADIDLALDNIMELDDKWILLDYEWILDGPVPLSFLKYRTAAYFYDRHVSELVKWYSREEYLERLGVSKERIAIFDKMEVSFQEYVRGVDQEYYVLKKYAKPVTSFEYYLSLPEHLKAQEEAIEYLNDLAVSKDEYIAGLEQLIKKYQSNPLYRIYAKLKRIMR